MAELAAYTTMIETASRDLRAAMDGIDDPEAFGRRPAPGANPVSFIAFHVLRHWDRDVNIFCRGQKPEEDAWQRAGFSQDTGYEPLGKGDPPIGTGYGYSAAEVDEVPADAAAMRRYHALLEEETLAFLGELDPSRLDAERTSGTGATFTIGGRLRHLIAHTYLHIGDIEYAKGLVGGRAIDVPSMT